MALQKSIGRVAVKGGGYLYAYDISTGTAGSYQDLGYVKENELMDETPEIDIKDETGDVIVTRNAGHKVTWKAILMQTGKDEIDFVKDTSDKTYQLRYKVEMPSGTWQAWQTHDCLVRKRVNVRFFDGERGLEVVFNIQKGDVAGTYYDLKELGTEPALATAGDWPTVANF